MQAKATRIGCVLKVTHLGAAQGAKSDDYDCLVSAAIDFTDRGQARDSTATRILVNT